MKRKNLYKILGVAIFIEDLLRKMLNLSKNDKNSKILGKKLRKLREKLKKTQQIRKKTRCTDGKGPG